MLRNCSHCQKPLTPEEFCKEESKGMEAERKALGLEGVLFRFYKCAGCGTHDIFVDIVRLDGEADEQFRTRRNELELALRQAQAEGTKVVLVERHKGFSVWN